MEKHAELCIWKCGIVFLGICTELNQDHLINRNSFVNICTSVFNYLVLPLAPEVSKTVFVVDAAPFLSILVGIYLLHKKLFL